MVKTARRLTAVGTGGALIASVLVAAVLGGGHAEAATATRIHDVQGAAHISPLKGTAVTVPGIVTATESTGFYLQDPSPDNNSATSEAVFVYTKTAPTVAVGDAATVTGTVSEYRPTGTTNLTTTELVSPTVAVTSSGNALPAPIVIGVGGRRPPATVIENDATGSVETSGTFDPATDGIDFYESLEGMRVRINNAVAVGPTNTYHELPVLADRGLGAGPRSVRNGIVLTQKDPNPERIILSGGLGSNPPTVDVGARAGGPAVGIMTYDFGNYMVALTSAVSFTSTLKPEVAAATPASQLSIATFNVENLAPTDPATKFARLAAIIVKNLRSPDILSLEEIQDNTGATDDGTVAADTTYAKLIAAITAAGGPAYSFRQIDPVNDQDGGQPGGNIRVGFLYAASRGVGFATAPAGDSTTAETVTTVAGKPHLALNPGRIDPASTAWNASRKPLAGEFTFRGKTVFVVANHFVSKLGDDPLFGRFQPPQQPSETQRTAQATEVNTFVKQILAVDPSALIAVVGDLNDMDFAASIKTLAGTQLVDLPSTLPIPERYTYVYEGNSEVLDHILLSKAAFRGYSYDVVHVNAEFADQASDHDPQLVRLRLP